MFSDGERKEYQTRILAWFENEARDFPWRRLRDPYAILVAEKLLQQSAARLRTSAAFEEIIRLYPAPAALADAEPAILESIIAPLGLKYRAGELRLLGQALVERHGGVVPLDLAGLLALPGIGDYAARAVLSFAYGQDVPVVDVNVARLLYRVFGISGPLPPNPARNRQLTQIAGSLVPAGKSRDYNLAVLDLCASLCVSGIPRCTQCPISSLCHYGQRAILAGSM